MTAAWGDQPDVVDAAVDKLRQEIRLDRLHTRATGSLPLDQERAQTELTEEQRARRSSRPNSRRWRGLGKIDDKIAALSRRLEEARQASARADERVPAAPEVDARSLAAWMAGGERGKRPEATLYERQRERDAARLMLEATQRTLDEALEERLHYVERHREKMLADARKDVEARRERLLAHVRAFPALRDELLDAREVLAWTATYPEQIEQFGFPTNLALGLQGPRRTHPRDQGAGRLRPRDRCARGRCRRARREVPRPGAEGARHRTAADTPAGGDVGGRSRVQGMATGRSGSVRASFAQWRDSNLLAHEVRE